MGARQLAAVGEELRDARLATGTSQAHVAAQVGISRQRYGRVERGLCPELTVVEVHRLAAVLGLTASLRLYPAGPPVRDVAHSSRLQRFLALAGHPMTYRLEVPLPARDGGFEQRAWDAVLFGGGRRTAVELEMRLRDVQALFRRVELKRRDDPTDGFILLVADTRHNRHVLAEFADLLVDLQRLRPSTVRASMLAGRHPGTGVLLV